MLVVKQQDDGRKGQLQWLRRTSLQRKKWWKRHCASCGKKGMEGLSAKSMASALGTSTQPVFTAFGSMAGIKQAVYDAAVRVYDSYTGKRSAGTNSVFRRRTTIHPLCARRAGALPAAVSDAEAGPFLWRDGRDAASAGKSPPDAGSDLSHHTGGSRRLFPRSVARGPQSCHP